jgi:hypothetical protein
MAALPPQPDGPLGPKPWMGDGRYIGPVTELWTLNNVGRPLQDYTDYYPVDIDIVISPTLKVALRRAVGNLIGPHGYGPLCNQIYPRCH